MSGIRLFSLSLAAAAGPLLASVLLLPAPAEAAIFASAPAAGSTLSFKSGAGTLTGKWAYRSIAISGDPKASLNKMALGSSEFDLVEQGGKITGSRPAGKGKTYDVTGFVVYGARKAPEVVLHSISELNGKTYEYDYFGYLMPTWNVGATQPDTFMGTVVRTDPSTTDAAVVVSFIASRVTAAPAGKNGSGLPVDSATPMTR
jgi:hypothetical protein